MNLTMTVEELTIGDVFTHDVLNPGEALIVDAIRTDTAYPNTNIITYHYLGGEERYTIGFVSNAFVLRITNLAEVTA